MSQDIGQAKAPRTHRKKHQFDYTIEVEDKQFKVNKNLMVSMSDYFKAMLTGGMVESQTDRVKLHGLSSRCVSNLIKFIYSGKLTATEVGEEELLECAIYLQMPTAIEECAKLLVNKLSDQNCFETLSILQYFNLENGVQETTQYINSNIRGIMQTCLPLGLSDNAFLNFSKFWKKAEWDHVNIVKEWVHMKYMDRSKYINELMSCVRFGLLTPEQLDAIKRMDIYTDFDGEWHQLVDNAEAYHKLPMNLKVLDESEQCTVRQDLVPIFYTLNDTSSSTFYSLYDGKSWAQHEAPGAPKFSKTWIGAHITVNNFLIVCEDYDYDPNKIQGWHIFDARNFKWSTMACMQIPRNEFAMVHYDKHLYVFGGRIKDTDTYDNSLLDVIERYDFETNTWKIIPSKMPEPLETHTAFVVDGLIYICGGKTQYHLDFVNRVDCLDLSTDTWYSKATFPGNYDVSKPRNMMELDGEKVLFYLDGHYRMHIYRPSVNEFSKWSDGCGSRSKMWPKVIVDKDNTLFLSGYDNGGFFFAKLTVVKPMEKMSLVRLGNCPIECSWNSMLTFLAIPQQF